MRHALPVRRELAERPADPELSADGRAQAEHLATYLSSEHLDAIYASPLRRARETAAAIAAHHPLEVQLRDGVAEFDRLSPDYIPTEELKAANDPRYHAHDRGRVEQRGRGIVGRVPRLAWCSTIEELIEAHPGQRIAVVCHGGVINSYLCHVLGLSNPAAASSIRTTPASTALRRHAAASARS